MASGPVRLSDIQNTKWNMFCYAKAGAGKSVFAMSSQVMRTFVFDIDQGVSSGKHFNGTPDGIYQRCRTDMIDVWPDCKTADEFLTAYTWLLNNVRNYQLVVLDTATELQKVIVDDILVKKKQQVATLQDWGVALNKMEYIFRQMRRLPCHTLVLAHEHIKQDPETGKNVFNPAFQGQMKFEFAKHFDEVWRYLIFDQQVRQADNTILTTSHRYLQCKPDQFTEAKDRSDSLLQYELPILDQILMKMSGQTR